MPVRFRVLCVCFFFFQAEDGIRDLVRSRGLGDVYKRQLMTSAGATIIAGSIYIFSPNDPKQSIAELPVANTISTETPKTEEPAPAVKVDLPSPVVNLSLIHI